MRARRDGFSLRHNLSVGEPQRVFATERATQRRQRTTACSAAQVECSERCACAAGRGTLEQTARIFWSRPPARRRSWSWTRTWGARRQTTKHITVYSVHASMHFHSVLALRVPLFTLSTFPVHASMRFTVYFPCTRLYAFHSLLSLRVPLCIPLSTFPVHASMHTIPAHASSNFTLYLPYACLFAFHCLICACLYAFHGLLFDLAAGAAGTYFAYCFCTSKLRLCSLISADGRAQTAKIREDSHGTTARAI